MSRGDLLRVFLRTDEQLRHEIDRIIRHCPWVHPDQLQVGVTDGVVTLSGRLKRRSGVRYLLRLLHELDGIVALDQQLTYEVDDVFPPHAATV